MIEQILRLTAQSSKHSSNGNSSCSCRNSFLEILLNPELRFFKAIFDSYAQEHRLSTSLADKARCADVLLSLEKLVQNVIVPIVRHSEFSDTADAYLSLVAPVRKLMQDGTLPDASFPIPDKMQTILDRLDQIEDKLSKRVKTVERLLTPSNISHLNREVA